MVRSSEDPELHFKDLTACLTPLEVKTARILHETGGMGKKIGKNNRLYREVSGGPAFARDVMKKLRWRAVMAG